MTVPTNSSRAPVQPGSSNARTLRRSLAITFTAVSLLSVFLLGLLNYIEARQLLTDSVTDRLVNQQAAKALAVRNGLDRLEETVIIAAQGADVINAVREFSAAYGSLQGGPSALDSVQSDEFDKFYDGVVDAIATAGADALLPDELQPRSDVGRYLQYHYIVSNPSEPRQRSDIAVAAGDDSGYGMVHAERHPGLARLRSQLGFGDLLLVDTEGNVVYSTNKRLDFATNAGQGPYRDTSIGEAVTRRIAAAPVGDAVFVDFEIYLPAGGKPSMFVAAAVREEARTIGAVLVEIPVAALNDITTETGDWSEAGLGETGEVYIVGRDQLMRTDSRLYLEDPDEYFVELDSTDPDPELGDLIRTFGSTVLLQPVGTEAVFDALDGERYLGRTVNYLDRKSLTVAGPVGAEQVDWVVVAEIASAEAGQPLREYLIRVLIAAAFIIPLVALVALFLADRMTKPVGPVVAAAAAVAGGELETSLPDLGRNEFGDIARRLNLLTADLRAREKALAEEEQGIEELLLSALPPRLVTALRRGERELLDLVDSTTVVAFRLTGMSQSDGVYDEAATEMSTQLSSDLEAIAERLGIERIRSSADQHVFSAGLGTPETAVAAAARFALEVASSIDTLHEETGVDVRYHAGISAGEVIAGLLSVDQLTYGVFGDPPRTALALSGIAAQGQILVDEATAAELGTDWDLSTAAGLVDLRGHSVAAMVLKARTEASPAS